MHEQYVQLYSALPVDYVRLRRVVDRDDLVPMLRSPKRLHLDQASFAGEGGLELDIAGLRLADEIEFRAGPVEDVPGQIPLARRHLRWAPVEAHEFHPTIDADLELEPIDTERTMVSLLASYLPPLGRVGVLIDRVALHRVAEAALRDYFSKLLRQLRRAAATMTGSETRSE